MARPRRDQPNLPRRGEKPFDVTLKSLINDDPIPFIEFGRIPCSGTPEVLDSALPRTLERQVDSVYKLPSGPEKTRLVHFELQLRHDDRMGERLSEYAALLNREHGTDDRPCVTRCVVLMLDKPPQRVFDKEQQIQEEEQRLGRPILDRPRPLQGYYCTTDESDPEDSQEGEATTTLISTFRYVVIKLWEISAETLLEGPLTMLPLIGACDLQDVDIPDLVGRINQRLHHELESVEERQRILEYALILLGMRRDRDKLRPLLEEALSMIDVRESMTFWYWRNQGHQQGLEEGRRQGIQEGREQGVQEGLQRGIQEGREQGVQEGREQGIQEGREQGVQEGLQRGQQEGALNTSRRQLLRIGSKRLGAPDEVARQQVTACEDLDRLDAAIDAVLTSDRWDQVVRMLTSTSTDDSRPSDPPPETDG